MPLPPRRPPSGGLGLTIGDAVGPDALPSAIELARQLGIDRLELDGRLIEAWLGVPTPTVPIEPVPADAVSFGLLELEEEVLADAYQLAKQSFMARLRDWRSRVSLDRLDDLRNSAHRLGITVDVLVMPGMASWSDDELEYVCRAGRALGVRALATPATLESPRRLVTSAMRHDLQPVIMVGPAAGTRPLLRLLEADSTLAVALDLVAWHGADQPPVSWLRQCPGRLSHIRVGVPDPSAIALVSACVQEAGAGPIFVGAPHGRRGWTRAMADAVPGWRHALAG